MPSNKRPRKKRVARPALLRPMTVGVSEDDARKLKLMPHQILDEFRTGIATEPSWHGLICRLNFGVMLGERVEFSRATHDEIRAALDAMVAVRQRQADRGCWVLTGDEMKCVGQALITIDDMQSFATRRESRDAMRATLAANAKMQNS